MVRTNYESEILEVAPNAVYSRENIELNFSSSRKELLGEAYPARRRPLLSRILKFFRAENVEGRDEDSNSAPPSSREKLKIWMKSPLNLVMLVWTASVTVPLLILFTVMTGMLNSVLTQESDRDCWIEACNQIATALFTLMCLFHHPTRLYHLVLLWRWNAKGVAILREAYSKNGTWKPNERLHMTIIIVSLHVNHFSQYAVSFFNVGYKKPERPVTVQGLCILVAIASGAVSSTYAKKSPLGRDYDENETTNMRLPEKNYAFTLRNGEKIVETAPKWRGGLLNVFDDIGIAYRSLFFSCCLFGRNMERLGFGNKYVHMANLLLCCIAPSVIFSSAAINIENETVKRALRLTGLAVSFFGVLYGGFWRIQLRKRYKLAESRWFCGEAEVTDCCSWSCCCCCCALAQEVRTAEFYDVLEVVSCNGEAITLPPQPSENRVLR